jgi:hypothetical protein
MSLPIPCCFGKYFLSIGQCAEKLTARRAEIPLSRRRNGRIALQRMRFLL